MFLCVSSIFGILSTGLAVWNTATNPIEVFFSIPGLYVYNGIACVSSLMCLILWGAQFAVTIQMNIGILYTIIGQMDTSGLASLGYSYWLVLKIFTSYIYSV